MSNIQSIFGLQSRQIAEPQLLDVKLFHDQAALWRTRVWIVLTEYRRIEKELAASRFLTDRHYLNMELAGIQNNLQGFWRIYRSVNHEAWRLDKLYRLQLDKRIQELNRKEAV